MTDLAALIRHVDPHARADIVAMVASHAALAFPKWQINTRSRQAYFLGHCSVETAGFTAIEENLNYSAARLLQVFPTHFTASSAAAAAHQPRVIANIVYGGRMGNRAGTDDGWLNRGKGLLDSTGRENNARLGARLGVSAEIASAWLIDPDHALDCACELFVLLGCLPDADRGVVTPAIVSSTRRVNGGLNGLADRELMIGKFFAALA